MTHETWDDVMRKPVLEFLNILCYINDRRAEDKRLRELWKNMH